MSKQLISSRNGGLFSSVSVLAAIIATSLSASAQAQSAQAAGTTSSSADETTTGEIVVTAQKKTERLQDVPAAVSVISAQSLTESNKTRFQDYFAQLPSVSLTQTYQQTPGIAIRGIGQIGGNPLVGVIVDDVPFNASGGAGLYGTIIPNIDPSDLQSVEVLRGPQGTLYGASSMGGLVKFTTNQPSTSALSAHMEAGLTTTKNAKSAGYTFRAGANVPLSDQLAIRFSGFSREDPGYIDNVVTGEKGVNLTRADGGRAAILWRPSDAFSVQLSALVDHTRSNGSANSNAGLDRLQQNNAPKGGSFDDLHQVYSGTIKGKLGGINITSVTGYISSVNDHSADYSPFYGAITNTGIPSKGFPGFGSPYVISFNHRVLHKFSQELRLDGKIGDSIDWLVGGFYDHETGGRFQDADPTNAFGAPIGNWITIQIPTKYREYAAFADVTAHFGERFKIQVGARESHNDQTLSQVTSGIQNTLLGGQTSLTVIAPPVSSHENAFTYLVTPQFNFDRNNMIYARLATGYRPGGPNFNASVLGLPPTVASDKTKNYEVGAKGDLFDKLLSYDISLYDIEWTDIQQNVSAPNGFGYLANGGKARSKGIEANLAVRPTRGLTLSGWFSVADAKILTVPSNSTLGAHPGDRIPLTPKFSGNFSISQAFELGNDIDGSVGASLTYVGERKGPFGSNPVQAVYPDYTTVDLHAGLNRGPFSLSVYLNNLTDSKGVIGGGVNTFLPKQIFYIQPRNAGFTIGWKFR
ncbi:TonB-dependent receptor [Sphingobium sp. sgz301303]